MFCLSGVNLWALLECDATEARRARNVTADATVEVQRYMTEPPLPRTEDPLAYWATHLNVCPNLYKLAMRYLCTLATSVPSERVFSKCGDVVNKKKKPAKANNS